MWLDTAIDMNERLDTLLSDDSDAGIDVDRYKKKSYDELSDCYNENLYIPSVPTLSQQSAIRMIADENVIDYDPKNFLSHDRSHFCTHGAAD